MTFNDRPIRLKLGLAIMGTSALVILLICGAFFVHDYVALGRNTLRQVSTLGQLVARNSTDALAFADPEAAGDLLGALADEPHILAAALYDRSGKVFAQYLPAPGAATLPSQPGKPGYVLSPTRVEGFQPVRQKGLRVGTLYLQFDRGAIVRTWFAESAGIACLVMLGALGAAYVCARALQDRICRPISTLADAARQVTERQDYSVRAIKTSNDEFGLLTDTFNQMLIQIQRLTGGLERRVQERTAQLENANRELEAFSYSVSHDLRAPLRHVDGFSAMLRKHAEATLDEKGRRLLNTISESAKRMGQLIDDLLAFSRINRSQLSAVDVDHDDLVASVIRDGRYESLPIEWSIAPLAPVRADPAMLRQVWANLIANAVKYSGKNPRPKIAIGTRRTEAETTFYVADNGVGFDMAYVDKLFGVFQRLHGPSEFEGTGIGLANVRRIVSRHGGRTWAEGRVGEGATFYFSLPVSTSIPLSTHDSLQIASAAHSAG